MQSSMKRIHSKKDWKRYSLVLAGIYNILWGAWVILFPKHIFNLTGTPLPHPLELWQCIGMIVGVYGLGYLVAADSPQKHWPIVLVGFLGKIFGPIGFILAIVNDVFPLRFGWTIVFNDLIWWIPFFIILLDRYKMFQNSINPIKDRISFIDFEKRKRAKFVNSLTGFKSSNLIGTIDSEGKTNLSIISSAFHLGADPSLIGFIIRPDLSPRHTLDNIRESKFCTLNHVNEDIFEKAHQTSARYDKNISEFKACELTEEYRDNYPAPFVKESNVQLALKLIREVNIEENGTHLLIMQIEDAYLPKYAVEDDGHINIEALKTICVSGLDGYHDTSNLGRLSYAKPDRQLSWIKK